MSSGSFKNNFTDKLFIYMWHNVVGEICFCGRGCGWVSVRWFLCLLWCETHTKGLCTRLPTRLEEDEERQGPRAVNKSQGKVTVRERQLLSEELGPVNPEAGSASMRGWVSVLGSCVGILFEYMVVTAQKQRMPVKCQKLLPSYA